MSKYEEGTRYMGEMTEYYSGDYGDISDNIASSDGEGPCPLCGLPGEGYSCNCVQMDDEEKEEVDSELARLRSRYEHLLPVEPKLYGYGIVDRDGKPYYDESCVCQDPEPMEDIVRDLNVHALLYAKGPDSRAPYRVVRLLYQEMDKSDESQYR